MLLIESGQLIGGVIWSLFSRCEQLIVAEASPANNRELVRALKLHQPEVVVLDDTVRANYIDQILRYMQKRPDMLRVVVVNTNNNHVQIYQKQDIEVSQTADLFEVL